MTKSQGPHKQSQIGPSSSTASTPKTKNSPPTTHGFHQHTELSKSSGIHRTSSTPSPNRHKRKREATNNATCYNTALTRRVCSRVRDYPGSLTTQQSRVVLTASTPSGALQSLYPDLIDTRRQDSIEAKMEYGDDETMFRIRWDLAQLGIELRENARQQIRWICQMEEDFVRSHKVIELGPFSSED